MRNDELFVEIQEIKQSLASVLSHLEYLDQLPVLDMQGDIQNLGASLWRLQEIECVAEDEREKLEDMLVP